jgi:hypothetical protein
MRTIVQIRRATIAAITTDRRMMIPLRTWRFIVLPMGDPRPVQLLYVPLIA